MQIGLFLWRKKEVLWNGLESILIKKKDLPLINGFELEKCVSVFPAVNHQGVLAHYALIAQRNLADRARPLAWHSSFDGRIGPGVMSR